MARVRHLEIVSSLPHLECETVSSRSRWAFLLINVFADVYENAWKVSLRLRENIPILLNWGQLWGKGSVCNKSISLFCICSIPLLVVSVSIMSKFFLPLIVKSYYIRTLNFLKRQAFYQKPKLGGKSQSLNQKHRNWIQKFGISFLVFFFFI